MAATTGRKIRVKKGTGVAAVGILGARTDGLTINNEPVDVTDKDDLGWTALLADPATRNVSLSVDGVLKDDVLIEAAMGAGSAILSAYEVEVEGFGTFDGDWFLNSVELGGAHNGEITFSASLSSSGEVDFTAAA